MTMSSQSNLMSISIVAKGSRIVKKVVKENYMHLKNGELPHSESVSI